MGGIVKSISKIAPLGILSKVLGVEDVGNPDTSALDEQRKLLAEQKKKEMERGKKAQAGLDRKRSTLARKKYGGGGVGSSALEQGLAGANTGLA